MLEPRAHEAHRHTRTARRKMQHAQNPLRSRHHTADKRTALFMVSHAERWPITTRGAGIRGTPGHRELPSGRGAQWVHKVGGGHERTTNGTPAPPPSVHGRDAQDARSKGLEAKGDATNLCIPSAQPSAHETHVRDARRSRSWLEPFGMIRP